MEFTINECKKIAVRNGFLKQALSRIMEEIVDWHNIANRLQYELLPDFHSQVTRFSLIPHYSLGKMLRCTEWHVPSFFHDRCRFFYDSSIVPLFRRPCSRGNGKFRGIHF